MKNNEDLSALKDRVYAYCLEFALDKVGRLGDQIKEIEDALTSETKSSAGDKHETGRAMLQLEREKLGSQLADAESTYQLANKVKISTANDTVALGSLVVTTGVLYFISISAGKYHENGTDVYCISPRTPIGKLLLGKRTGDVLSFNSNTFKIQAIG